MTQQTSVLVSALPAPPADPLHVIPEATLWLLLAAAGLLILFLAWFVLRHFFRRRPSPASASPSAPASVPAPAPAIGIATRIQAIERKFLESKAFRDGCHALAGAAKTHLGQRTGLGMERMTSLEIADAVEDERIGSFMIRLSRRRYGRDEPRRKHFVEACTRLRELLT